MIFRRIKAHIEKENWFAVGIDFCIVVIGVFIGIQVANWNEAQQDRVSAKDYHARLVTDVELSIERNQAQIAFGRQEVRQLDLILSALDECQLRDEDEPVFAAGLYNMGKFSLPVMVMGTIDELNATGNFPLIGSPQLRRTISETVREYQIKLAVDSQIAGRSIPSINYVRTRVRFLLEDHQPRLPSMDPDKVIYDFEALCVDESFIHAVATVRELTLIIINLNQQMIEYQTELLAELGGSD